MKLKNQNYVILGDTNNMSLSTTIRGQHWINLKVRWLNWKTKLKLTDYIKFLDKVNPCEL